MVADWHLLVGIALAAIALFAVVMVASLRFAQRAQTRNLRELTARDAWSALGASPSPDAPLLYGIWQTGVHEVTLVVRDQHDADVGTVTHRLSGTTITVGERVYAVVSTSPLGERAVLVTEARDAGALCRVASSGWGGNQRADYTPHDSSALTVANRWSWPWRHAALPVREGERVVGQWSALGGAFDTGRVLALPASVPLPVQMLILWRGAGAPLRPGGR